jgi:hypothetical protein
MPPAQPCVMGIADGSAVWLSLVAQLDVDIKTAIVAVLNNFNLVIYLSSTKQFSKTRRRNFNIRCQAVFIMKIRRVSNSD